MESIKNLYPVPFLLALLLFSGCQNSRDIREMDRVNSQQNEVSKQEGKVVQNRPVTTISKDAKKPYRSTKEQLSNIVASEEKSLTDDNSYYSKGKKRLPYTAKIMLRKNLGGLAPRGLTVRQRYNPNFHTESYDRIYENDFVSVKTKPLSTFSIDVDTASYSNVRRFLRNGSLPPKDSVRIEEMINYFSYDYEQPAAHAEDPIFVQNEITKAPWNPSNYLVQVAMQTRKIQDDKIPARNLVFLIDVSGSMTSYNKLPLLKKAMQLLAKNLRSKDRISIVVYAGAAGMVLEPTTGDNRQKIYAALEKLSAGGSTNGGEGIRLAYKVAQEQFVKGGINRVILASDGDFNVGTTSQGELVRLIEDKRKSGVFLSVLGFGMGNYKDSTMEKLADKGNGNYSYIDTMNEARKVLVTQSGATLMTVAKDVKIQIEFNPQWVKEYRLIGYENRVLQDRDFNDDKKDAGEVGAGHSVTALYEVVPVGGKSMLNAGIDPLRYSNNSQNKIKRVDNQKDAELMTVKLRYKKPDGHKSKLAVYHVRKNILDFDKASNNLKFASSVAAFGMQLRGSKYKGAMDFDRIWETAHSSIGKDPHGYRSEFLQLVKLAKELYPDAKSSSKVSIRRERN